MSGGSQGVGGEKSRNSGELKKIKSDTLGEGGIFREQATFENARRKKMKNVRVSTSAGLEEPLDVVLAGPEGNFWG